jgi:MYXO-CTERM domain-containing protein
MYVTNDFKDATQLAAVPPIVLDLGVEAAAGRYKGGQIGFFLVSSGGTLSVSPTTHLITGNLEYQFFTQHALNVGSTPTATTYNVLTWESVTKKNTFYFGWEDLPPNKAIDNDFDDFLFSVSGVQCGGGGQPCETGKLGVCAAGTLQCKKSVIQCIQNVPEGPELCNALDDDCNGMVDDGELCAEGELCDHGVCVARCGTGEFRCPGDLVCAQTGFCVDAACETVECPEGQICSAGECVDSCTGIVCPTDRLCRNGGCVDPCVGIECDEGFACVLGVCTSCECSACGAGLVCHDSQCVDTGCESMTCGAGTHCAMGACVDNCEGTTCPVGQMCAAGECVVDPSYQGPGSGGSMNGTAGSIVIENPNGGANATGGKGSGSSSMFGDNDLDVSKPACGCEVPGHSRSERAALLALGLLGLALARRRYRR